MWHDGSLILVVVAENLHPTRTTTPTGYSWPWQDGLLPLSNNETMPFVGGGVSIT